MTVYHQTNQQGAEGIANSRGHMKPSQNQSAPAGDGVYFALQPQHTQLKCHGKNGYMVKVVIPKADHKETMGFVPGSTSDGSIVKVVPQSNSKPGRPEIIVPSCKLHRIKVLAIYPCDPASGISTKEPCLYTHNKGRRR